MDKEQVPILQELNNMQLKISYLFLDLLKEKNELELNFQNLNKRLQQSSSEAEDLKKQNEILKQNNEDMRNIIEKGIAVFKYMDFSNLNTHKEQKISLETLKKCFFEFHKKVEISKATGGNIPEGKGKNIEIDKTRYKLSDEEIKKEFEGLNSLSFFTDFSYEKPFEENSSKRDYVINGSRSDTVLKSLFQNISVIKSTKGSSLDCENETFDDKSVLNAEICGSTLPLREGETYRDRSPVFKDFGIRRFDSLSNEDSGSNVSTSLPSKLINEKFLDRSDDLMISPWEKSPLQATERTPSKKSPAPKRTRKKLKIKTPERSPCAMLKKSNMREAEISFSGIRKLRQTLLNVDCYKKNSLKECKDSENRENENFKNCIGSSKSEKKVLIVDEEDDDFITESPNKADQILEDVKIKKSQNNLNEVPFITPPKTSDLDLDETYISSSLVQKCNATNKRELERVIQDHTPSKRRALEKSPEYDSVPFVYKREPVRKKSERMKLPGHACLECMKYYENVFGELDTQNLKNVLNKCSRHRDKNSPAIDDTPPGYWKPYLTCSTIISPNKDDVSKAIVN